MYSSHNEDVLVTIHLLKNKKIGKQFMPYAVFYPEEMR